VRNVDITGKFNMYRKMISGRMVRLKWLFAVAVVVVVVVVRCSLFVGGDLCSLGLTRRLFNNQRNKMGNGGSIKQ
jgi:hypothetical protein